MSNVAVFNPSKVPTFAKGRTSALSQALGGNAGGGRKGKSISIRGGVFLS